MKRIILTLIAAAFLFVPSLAFAQEQQEPDVDKIIENQLENLTRTFHLDEVQIFFIDSILQYNYPAMMAEYAETRKTGASNADTYQAISDKWMDATDRAFEKIFTEDQWKRYLKSTYGKEKKRRDKRMAERGL